LGSIVGIPLACSGQNEPPIVRGLDPAPVAGTGGTAGLETLPGAGTASAMGGRTTLVVMDAGTAAIDQMGLSGGGGEGGDNSCAGEEHPAELIPIDMFIMLDRSLSMYAKTSAGVTKWDAITTALEAFVSDPNSDGIGVGLQYFPTNPPCTGDEDCDSGFCFLKACRTSRSNDSKLPGLIPCVRDMDCPGVDTGDTCVDVGGCGDQSCVSVSTTAPTICENGETCTGITQGVCTSETVCTLSDYTKAEVDIAQLPGVKDAFIESIQAFAPGQSPFGLTPTGPALEGAIAYARAWAEDHPTRRAIVVLATDGAPTGGCTPSRRSEIAALASVGAGAAVPVRTYTIGVFSPVDPENPSDDAVEGPDNIRAIATAGGGEAFVISDQSDVATQFVKALNSVRGHGLSCDYQIPKPDMGKLLDYGKVNVAFTPKAGEDAEIIPYVDDGVDCDEDGGWYYVRESSASNPSGIRACPATCRELMDSVTGNVNIQVGCETIRREPVK
jgi:hypothetical protein